MSENRFLMYLKLNNKLLLTNKQSFRFKFTISIVFFSFAMATLIYLRESSSRNNIIFIKVVFWQLMLWLPWVFALNLIKKSIKIINKKEGVLKYVLILLFFILPLSIHWIWFAAYSSLYSPYIGVHNEGYGVFPYFFIFWSLIDFMLLLFIFTYFIFYKKELKPVLEKVTTIQVKRGNKKVFLKGDDIFWISAEGYYIMLYTTHGQFLLRRSLKDIFLSLPRSQFIKIHRSAIINILHLNELQQPPNKGISVLMKDGNSHPVSRTHVKSLKEALNNLSI